MITNLINSLLNLHKKIDLKLLPSQGYFYKEDFEISIKKADMEDIIEYEHQYTKDNLFMNIHKVKRVVESNIILSRNYCFFDIKSIDIVFLFFEIVKFTMNKAIVINYGLGELDKINFGPENFNYFDFKPYIKNWDESNREFVFDDYRYSLPTIGAENSLTNFLLDKNMKNNPEYNTYCYDFNYFLNHKPMLNFSEIENLIQIFNFDMEEKESKKVREIVQQLNGIQKYSLKRDNRIIDVNSKIDLETIWK